VWVLPRGLGVEGQNVCVLQHGLVGPVDLKNKAIQGPVGSEVGFGALGGRGVNNFWLTGFSD
jgi:hypothetical protein